MKVIVNTDNYGGDYPDEKVLSYTDSEGTTRPIKFDSDLHAHKVADLLNERCSSARYWVVRDETQKLEPGFSP